MTMKKITILALVLFSCEQWVMAQGQSYPAVRPGQIAIYQSPHHPDEFRGIRIDSVYSPKGTDSLLFMYHTVNDQTGCIDTSWLGTEIFKQGTNKTYFVDGLDTVTVENDAVLTQGWQVTSYPNGNKLKAKVLAIVYDPVHNDSIKEMGIELKDSLGNEIANPINDLEMWLSEDYGMQKFYDTQTLLTDTTVFNLIGLTNSNFGFQNYGAKEVFRFSPGEILEWRESYQSGSTDSVTTTQWTILTASSNGDSSIFTYSIARQIQTVVNSVVTMSSDTISQTYTLSDYAFLQDLPDEYFLNAPNGYGSGWVTFDTAHYNTTYIVKNVRYNMTLSGTCFQPATGGTGFDDAATFASELGMVKWINDSNNGNAIFDTTKLTFFRKDGVQWGTSAFASGISSVKNTLHVQVYPNPFSDQFLIQFPKMITSGTITLSDASGKILLSQSVRNSNYVNENNLKLSKGVYLLSVTTEQGNWNQKIVKN